MDWHYCQTAQNPADVGTWIIFPNKLIIPWIEGPKFLCLPVSDRPVIPFDKNPLVNVLSLFVPANNVKPIASVMKSNSSERFLPLIKYYSDFQRLIQSFCYIFRVFKLWFIKNMKKIYFFDLSTSPLTVQECNNSESYIIKQVQ